MMVYGVTVIDSDGLGDGTESWTKLFADKEEAEKYAYEQYKECFDCFDFEDGKDANDNPPLSEEKFLDEVRSQSAYAYIQGHSSHIQVELFEQEL